MIKVRNKMSFTLHKCLTPTHQRYRSSGIILIPNNDIKKTVALKTRHMSSNEKLLQRRYDFPKQGSKIEKVCVYWMPDAKK